MKGITSPEGIIMLTVAGVFDLASTICAILIAVFGLGALLNYIVGGVSLITMGTWMLIRYSSLGSEGGMKVQENEEDAGNEEPEEEQVVPEKDKGDTGGRSENSKEDNQQKTPAKSDLNKNEDSLNKNNDTLNKSTPKTLEKNTANPSTGVKGKGGLKNPKEMIKGLGKDLAKKALNRFALNFLIEAIPGGGCIWPANLIIVWQEMKEQPPKASLPQKSTDNKTAKEVDYASKA